MSFAKVTKCDVQRTLVTSRNKASKNVANKGHARTGVSERPVTALQRTTVELPQRAPRPNGLKPIPIRHTLTSKLRMEKANPLLTTNIFPDINEFSQSQIEETPVRRSTFHPGMLQTRQKLDFRSPGPVSESRPNTKKSIMNKKKKSIGSCLFKENMAPFRNTHPESKMSKTESDSMISKQSQMWVVDKNVTSSFQKGRISSSMQNKNISSEENKNIQTSVQSRNIHMSIFKDNSKHILNTSIKLTSQKTTEAKGVKSRKAQVKGTSDGSCVQISQSNKCINSPVKKQLKSILRKSASTGDLRKVSATEEPVVLSEIENQPSVTAKSLNKCQKTVAFYSPLHNITFSPVNVTNTPPSALRKELEDWLIKRGKSLSNHRHLWYFGLPKNATVIPSRINESEEPPLNETITSKVYQNAEESHLNETITLESSDSTVILSPSLEKDNEIDIDSRTPKGSSTPQQEEIQCSDEDKENAVNVAHPEALNDLKKLVHLGYPRDQCAQWLGIIAKSYPVVMELPQYWECLAALEEAQGEFGSAVACYEQAVVKGADAQDIDEHLDELWEKLSALSMSAAHSKRTPTKKLAVDTKQLFKSTIIKFALQQKAVKKFSKETGLSMQSVNYIVTPVRHSNRRSVSQFKTTSQ